MRSIRLKAPAKVNLTLDVTGRRPDGYHYVEMLMQSINLWDYITLKYRHDGISILCDSQRIPQNEDNIAFKAALLLKEKFKINAGADIIIEKKIPVSAGLAGGSADAAAVLVGLNRLWDMKLSQTQLADLGARLGADVPFCITGGTAVAEGIGDRLKPLKPIEDVCLILVKPPFGVSTASVYKALDLNEITRRPDATKVYNLLADNDFSMLSSYMVNVLEQVTASRYPVIGKIKNSLKEMGAKAALMTGSGPTVYGVFDDNAKAQQAYNQMKQIYNQVYIVHTIGHGIEILEGGSHE